MQNTRSSPALIQMWGSSAALGRVRNEIARVAYSEATVLIIGESGTGKELVARAIHENSSRSGETFVAVNCGALPASLIEAELFGYEKGSFTGASRAHTGVFERAGEGTLFLDEIAEMPIELQTRLLRVIESRRFYRIGGSKELSTPARIVAASNRNPLRAVRDGLLREDLLYRLAVFPLVVPPLRERGPDAGEIAARLLTQLNAARDVDKRLSTRSVHFLREYRWPGNVRELRNIVERGFLLADEEIDLEPAFDALLTEEPAAADGSRAVTVPVGTSLQDAERVIIEATVAHLDGNKAKAALTLGCSLKTLYNKLRLYAEVEPAAHS